MITHTSPENQQTMKKLEAMLAVGGVLNVPTRIKVDRDAKVAIVLLPVVRLESLADGKVRAHTDDGSYVENAGSEPLEALYAALTKEFPAVVKNLEGEEVPNPDLATDAEWTPIRDAHQAKRVARAKEVLAAEAAQAQEDKEAAAVTESA